MARLTLNDLYGRIEMVNDYYHYTKHGVTRSAERAGVSVTIANQLLMPKSKWDEIDEFRSKSLNDYFRGRGLMFHSILKNSRYKKTYEKLISEMVIDNQ
jgi:hypothetical protein